MSCGKRSRPRNVTGLEAVEWYKEHRCEIDHPSNCWRWRPEFADAVEYLKRRYAPDRLMLMLTGRDRSPDPLGDRQFLIRNNDCAFIDCINPSHLDFCPLPVVRTMVKEGYFRKPGQLFTWDDGLDPPAAGTAQTPPLLGRDERVEDIDPRPRFRRPRPISCTVGQLRCIVEAQHTWNHYTREYIPAPGFGAWVRLRSDFDTLFQCDGFEAQDDAESYCEALVRGDEDEVSRLVQVAEEDWTRRSEEDEFKWVDQDGYGPDQIGRETARVFDTAIATVLDDLARKHQLSRSLTRRRFWEDVIERAEGLARNMREVLPADVVGEVAGQPPSYGKEPRIDNGPASLQRLAKGYRTAEGVIHQNEAGGYRLSDDLIQKGDAEWAAALYRHLNTVVMAISLNGSEVVDFSELEPDEIEAALWIRRILADSYGDELAVTLMNIADFWEWGYDDYID